MLVVDEGTVLAIASVATVLSVTKQAASLFAIIEARRIGKLGNLNPSPVRAKDWYELFLENY